MFLITKRKSIDVFHQSLRMCLFYMPIKVRMLKRAFLEGKLNVRNLELSNTMHKYRNAITFFATFFFQTLKLDSYVTATTSELLNI